MAFFGIPSDGRGRQVARGVSLEFLHKHECAACPLNNQAGSRHPHMEPTGAARPLAYFLGDAPDSSDDRKGEQFSSQAGRVLRHHLPGKWLDKVRFNNCVRDRPLKGKAPAHAELECCFPAGTQVVPVGQVKSLYRRWYDGPLMSIETRSGCILSGTPNHPVFTPLGKVALGTIKVGDNLFRTGLSDRCFRGRVYKNYKPASIEKIFESALKVFKVERVATSALDFHGDGMVDGEVDIIRTNGVLLADITARSDFVNKFDEFQFPTTNSGFCALVRACAFDVGRIIFSMVAAFDSFFSRVRYVPSGVSCTCGPYLNTTVAQVGAQPISVNPLISGDAFSTFSSFISTNNITAWFPCFVRKFLRPAGSHVFRFRSEFNSLLEEMLFNCRVIGAGKATECNQTGSVDVELDEVVSVKIIRRFAGHVYNLETSTGQYIAENVLVSNCRPSIERDVEQSGPAAIVGFGPVPLSWAGVAESGIAVWSGRRTPVTVAGKPYWYFPVAHPSAVQQDPKWRGLQRQSSRYGSEHEFQFALHLRRALVAIEVGLPEPVVHTPEMVEEGCEWVTGAGGDADVERVREFLGAAAQRKVAGIDYETSGLRPYAEGARILTAAVSIADGALAFPLDHREAKWSRRQRAQIDDAWREFLYEAGCRKVAHHLAFEMEWSAFFYGRGCLRAGRWGDSLAQAYVLDERPGAHSLDFLVKQYFGVNLKAMFSLNKDDLDHEPLEKVLRYNGPDAKYCRLLYVEQARELKRAGLAALYAEHLERVPTAVLTQIKGVPISQEAALGLGKKYVPRMIEAERALRAMPAIQKFERQRSTKFRPSANEDVKYVVNSLLGYALDSVDGDALATVDHEFAREEMKWRKAAKIYGTYVTPVADEASRAELEGMRREGLEEIGGSLELKSAEPSRVYPDGLLHPQTNVSRVRTSRTSSNDPNYQNWPKRGAADAIGVRRMVRPLRPGELIVSFDYGQIQARNVGMESLDSALLKAFWEDYDIHAAFMEHLARIYPRWVKEGVKVLARDPKLQKKYRNDVKHGFVFASFFGAQAKKTAGVLGVPLRIGEKLGEIFWDQFGGIKTWHEQLEKDYYRTGYVTGHAGYRRRAPVSYNERINSPIQADEAKIVLDAMTRLSKIDHDVLQASMEIHDDLTFVWPKSKVDELAPIVIREMLTTSFEWAKVTPIVVEMAVGEDWANLKEPDEHVFASNKYDGLDMPRRSPL